MVNPVAYANSRGAIDRMDLLHNRNENSLSTDADSASSSNGGGAPKIAKKIDRFLDRSKKSLVSSFKDLGYLHQIDEEEGDRHHVPFQSITRGKNGGMKECLACLGMAAALTVVMAGMFGIILLLAFHPKSPTVSIDRVSNGTLFLFAESTTILVARLNLTLLAKNPNANAEMRFEPSSLGLWFGDRNLGRFQVRAFTQPARMGSTPFLAVIDSTTNLTGSGVEQKIRAEFRQQNATFGLLGYLRVQRRVASVVPSNAVVNVNCSMSFSPSFPPSKVMETLAAIA
ncbi:hypothetical protein SELMODRAFT_431383 [Selaginella moellendorffii]|uniref:Late embryogenesis abundant protein LEA-2 subgroup domain-containing protein n=1 Tax=Selaginella moellendorffii TaxID=88036 RepID=D8TCF2_SELML|nr:hypothetical protein SELMODRAFT_431383 [Selaginella moellendorffii]